MLFDFTLYSDIIAKVITIQIKQKLPQNSHILFKMILQRLKKGGTLCWLSLNAWLSQDQMEPNSLIVDD